MLSPLFPEERHADTLPSQTEVQLNLATATRTVECGGYEPADGLMPGSHYRKVRGKGCYHLRLVDHAAFLHWDRWDPRRFPVRHFFESPALMLPVLAVGAIVLMASKE